MDRYKVLKVWTFSEWNQLERKDRPEGARPYANGWVLLEEIQTGKPPAPSQVVPVKPPKPPAK